MIKTAMPRKPHEGRNLKRIREILGVKQDTIAMELDITQQSVSGIEQKETIDPALLEQIAGILKVPADAIRNFNEDATMNYIIQHFSDNAVMNNIHNYGAHNYQSDPADRAAIASLYEALLKSEREKVAILEKLLEKVK